MKTLYIHIGCPKTGTTSLQYFCNENKEILSENGIYFPVFEQKYSNVNPYRNGHFLIAHQFDSSGKIDILKEKQIFRFNMDHILHMFSEYDNILLSDEALWAAHFYKKNLWKTLHTEALRNNFRVKIIIYLRRQDTLLNAMWNQKIKKSQKKYRSMTWKEIINVKPPVVYLNYEEGLNEIANELGEENLIVRRYGEKYFKNGSIYDDFLSTLGLCLTDDYTISTFDRNTRLSANSTEIQRLLNCNPDAEQTDFTFFYHMLSEVSSENPDEKKLQMFQPEEAAAFMEKYREGNRNVMEKYFHKSEDLFNPNFKNIQTWAWDSRSMTEDLIRLLGHTTIALRKENDELRQRITKLEQETKKQTQALTSLKTKLKHPAKTIITKIMK